ncbi:MAG: hypothetical protein AB8B68_06175 [Rickettsiaceae bacterium]
MTGFIYLRKKEVLMSLLLILALSSVKDIRVEHKAESLEHKDELLNQKEDQTLLGDNLNQHDPEN